MKTIVGKIVSIAALTLTAPLISSAAAPTTLNNGVSRDLNHLTLLTGPDITSPPRPIVAARPENTFASPSPEVGTFRYVPPPPETEAVRMTGPGRLTLRKTDEPATSPTPPAATSKKPLPDPASLRFDSKLHPTPTRGTMERVPEPKRD